MSYPAAKALPRVGRRALSESFLIRSAGAAIVLVVVVDVGSSSLTRLAGCEAGDVWEALVLLSAVMFWIMLTPGLSRKCLRAGVCRGRDF